MLCWDRAVSGGHGKHPVSAAGRTVRLGCPGWKHYHQLHVHGLCGVGSDSLIGRGEARENISFAVVDSIVKKVCSQAGQLYTGAGTACLTGGLCGMAYLRDLLSKALGVPVLSCEDGRYAGAIGAALCGAAIHKRKKG